MIICNSKRYIYIHLHKCAGTSIELALSESLRWNDILLGSTLTGEQLQPLYSKLYGLGKHSSAAQVKAVVGAEVWGEYYTFSTIRNPFALALSQYTYSLQNLVAYEKRLRSSFSFIGGLSAREHPYPGVKALIECGGRHATFSQFIRSQHLKNWSGFTNQYEQLADENGKLLVNEVIKIEDLHGRWPSIMDTLGLEGITLRHENKSTDGTFRIGDMYSNPDDVEYICSVFKKDFDNFDYSDNLRNL